MRIVLQELIETELIETIGAARFERSEERSNERNGSRLRLLATQAGDVELTIPKLRKGSFFPSTLEPRRRMRASAEHDSALLPRNLPAAATSVDGVISRFTPSRRNGGSRVNDYGRR